MQYFALSVLCLVICTARCSSAASVAAVGNSIKLSRFVRRPLFGAERNPCEPEPKTYQQWPRNIIHYKYSDALNETLKLSIQEAIEKLEKSYCVQFVPRTNAQHYALFEQGQHCCTHKGYLGSGAQKVYVEPSCASDPLGLLAKLAGITLNATSPARPSTSQNTCEGVCGHSLHLSARSTGEIKSPGYPSMHYPSNSMCTWKLWIPATTFLELTFVHFDVEQDSECNYDYVRILEQNSIGSVINERHYCGSIPLKVINSTAAVITIEFISDEDEQREGFQLQYSVRSPGIHHAGSLPNLNQCSINNGGCEHNCIESSGIKNCTCRSGFSLAPDGQSCQDINECAANGTLCQQRCKNTAGSYYCHCRPGFGLSSNGRDCDKCGRYLNVTKGNFKSPGFPSPYPANQNCDWHIYIHAGHYLNVTLSKVDIIKSVKCQANHLRLQHSKFRHSRRLCGHYEIINYIVKRSEIYSRFRFITSNTNEARGTGFSLEFSQVKIEQLTSQELNFVRIDQYTRNKLIPYNSRVWN